MRVVRRRRSVDRVATRVRRHRHDRHAVGEPAVDRLEVLVVERLLPHDRRQSRRRCPCRRSDRARRSVAFVSLSSSPPRPISRWATAWRYRSYSSGSGFQLGELLNALTFQLVGLGAEPVGLRVEERAHVGFGHRRDGLEDAFLAAAGARAVARHQGVVVSAHHQHVAQRGGLGVLRPRVVVKAEVLLGVSGSRSRKAVPVSCSALTSSVSCTIRSAWCSPQAVTQAAQPLQRSDTKMEKTPPMPGIFFSGVAKIAFVF